MHILHKQIPASVQFVSATYISRRKNCRVLVRIITATLYPLLNTIALSPFIMDSGVKCRSFTLAKSNFVGDIFAMGVYGRLALLCDEPSGVYKFCAIDNPEVSRQ